MKFHVLVCLVLVIVAFSGCKSEESTLPQARYYKRPLATNESVAGAKSQNRKQDANPVSDLSLRTPYQSAKPSTNAETTAKNTVSEAPVKKDEVIEQKAEEPELKQTAAVAAIHNEVLSKSIRTITVEADEASEAELKKYSVVVASLTRREGVERLKRIFKAERELISVAVNDAGFFYFILGSFDELGDAIDKTEQLKRRYSDRYSAAQLQSKYGIPFTNLWILKQE